MITIHKSGLVITERKDHFECYDGDARYVVWNLDNEDKPKVSLEASYLPTLVRWLDMKYANNTTRYALAKRNLQIIRKVK